MRAKHWLIAAATLIVLVIGYMVASAMAWKYTLDRYIAIQTGMPRAQVQRELYCYAESQLSAPEWPKRGWQSCEDNRWRTAAHVYRYDLFGWRWSYGTMCVAYDRSGHLVDVHYSDEK